MSSKDLEKKLTTLADALIDRAKDKDTRLDDSVKVFREVREFYSILTKPTEPGDKPTGRQSTTMNGMRRRVADARGDHNGRAEPAVQDAVGRA